ncbi:MAG: hypothetical protein ABSE28_18070 [Candidatus Sulfotelmatobacter sp.]
MPWNHLLRKMREAWGTGLGGVGWNSRFLAFSVAGVPPPVAMTISWMDLIGKE